VLSRGTREQLFVSLRLALVAAYARRGIHLPMILDDVFVNFDAARTRTACAVLRDFAKQGHQLLVFTCHEHVWRMFQELKVDTRRIPNRLGDVEVAEPAPEPPQLRAAEPIAVLPMPEEPAPSPILVEQIRIPPITKEPEETPIPVVETPKPAPAPAITEVEYWWDAEAPATDNREADLDEQAYDWVPDAEFVGTLPKSSGTRSSKR
jgi:hypothetical protein